MKSTSSPVTTPHPRPHRARYLAPAAVAFLLSLALAGCGGTVSVPGGSGGTPTPVAGYLFLTGNWQFQVTPTSGTSAPFTTMAGFINEQGQNPGNYDESTAVFQVAPATGCYDNAPVIPLSGNVQGTAAKYSGFSVNGQYLGLSMTRNTAGDQLTGTYKNSGGCGNGETGTVTGTRYTALTGTYAGSIGTTSPAPTVSLSTSQYAQGTGNGVTDISGNATFTGFTCFTKGSLSAGDSYVLGSSVIITVNTNDPTGAQAIVTGTFDSGATTVTVTSVQVTSGSCSGSYGASTLNKQ